PLLAAAVHQRQVHVAIYPRYPVGERGEPVVVVAIEHQVCRVADPALAHQFLETSLGRDVAADRMAQLRRPVDSRGATDVAAVIGGCVHVDFEQSDPWILEMLGYPIG